MLTRAFIIERPPPLPFAVALPHVLGRLRLAHLAVAVVHLAQAFLVLAHSASESQSISETGSSAPILTISVGAALAIFFAALAVIHGVSATALASVYERDLRRGRNGLRWSGMCVTAPLMMLLVALLAGIHDVARLAVVVSATLAMVVFASMQERLNPPGRRETTMIPIAAAIVTGLVPWGLVLIEFATNRQQVYTGSLFVSLFVLWASVWVNAVLQYRQVGPWADYLYGERTSMVLSLVVNSALAWEIVVAFSMA